MRERAVVYTLVGLLFLTFAISSWNLFGAWFLERRVKALEDPNRISAPRDANAGPAPLYTEAIALIHWRESRNGADPDCRKVGSDGERGEYQQTPDFLDDIERIGGERIDPTDNAQAIKAIRIYFDHYALRVGAKTPDELYELYNRGPTAYRKRNRHEQH